MSRYKYHPFRGDFDVKKLTNKKVYRGYHFLEKKDDTMAIRLLVDLLQGGDFDQYPKTDL